MNTPNDTGGTRPSQYIICHRCKNVLNAADAHKISVDNPLDEQSSLPSWQCGECATSGFVLREQ